MVNFWPSVDHGRAGSRRSSSESSGLGFRDRGAGRDAQLAELRDDGLGDLGDPALPGFTREFAGQEVAVHSLGSAVSARTGSRGSS